MYIYIHSYDLYFSKELSKLLRNIRRSQSVQLDQDIPSFLSPAGKDFAFSRMKPSGPSPSPTKSASSLSSSRSGAASRRKSVDEQVQSCLDPGYGFEDRSKWKAARTTARRVSRKLMVEVFEDENSNQPALQD